MLLQGRIKLIEEEKGRRYKLRSKDNNDVDTLFVDNRENGLNGKTLVICSEGNAGFYEIGNMAIPIELKYSVLGWNHPGFGGSTVSNGNKFEEKRNLMKFFCRENHSQIKIKTQSMRLCNLLFKNLDFYRKILFCLVGALVGIHLFG